MTLVNMVPSDAVKSNFTFITGCGVDGGDDVGGVVDGVVDGGDDVGGVG